ncbi:MAG: hypothetical protein ACRED9_00380 [Caulobacteraceae bacterium]
MKTVKIQGGLGNQLFCLALARSLGLVSGEAVAIDCGSYEAERFGRRFELAELACAFGLKIVRRRPIPRLARALLRALSLGITEPEAGESELARLAVRNGYFDGYWQDERWIADPEPAKQQVRRFVAARASALPAPRLLLHYRTYAEEPRIARRGAPSAAWCEEAVRIAEARLGGEGAIALISDAPALALERLGALAERLEVLEGDPFSHLGAMMRARALILCNSSFSWWGGYCSAAEVILWPRRAAMAHYPRPAARFDVI